MKRADIVACARTYVDTPFVHQGRMKGKGIDCVGLVICVAAELGLQDKLGKVASIEDLPQQYSHMPQGNLTHDTMGQHLHRKGMDAMKPGDVVTCRFRGATSHAAILGSNEDGLTLIHAYSGEAERCVEHPLDEVWKRRIAGVFEFPEVED